MTQRKRILNHLKSGKSITALSALKLFGCFRLASRINQLREMYNISTEMVKVKSGARIAKYSLIR